MQEIDDLTYHIYVKERCIYHSLNKEEFEEKWQLLHVMVDLISSEYNQDDLSYERLAPKVGLGGPGKLLPIDEDHAYRHIHRFEL